MNAEPEDGVFFPVMNLQSHHPCSPRQRGLCSSVQEMQNAEGLICLSGPVFEGKSGTGFLCKVSPWL